MNAHALITSRGGPYGRAMGAATTAHDAAYKRCRDDRLRELAAVLDDAEGRMWNRDDDAGKLVAVALKLAATLALESPHLKPDLHGAACSKLVQSIAAAQQDAADYYREEQRGMLRVYRALYNGLQAHCTDLLRRTAARSILRGATLGSSLARSAPSRVDIEPLGLAISVLKGDEQA